MLQVNFRGSTGYGKDSIDSLLGQIGRNDVDDVATCTQDVIEKEPMIDGNSLSSMHPALTLPSIPLITTPTNYPYYLPHNRTTIVIGTLTLTLSN